jgi:hypothetical protein
MVSGKHLSDYSRSAPAACLIAETGIDHDQREGVSTTSEWIDI